MPTTLIWQCTPSGREAPKRKRCVDARGTKKLPNHARARIAAHLHACPFLHEFGAPSFQSRHGFELGPFLLLPPRPPPPLRLMSMQRAGLTAPFVSVLLRLLFASLYFLGRLFSLDVTSVRGRCLLSGKEPFFNEGLPAGSGVVLHGRARPLRGRAHGMIQAENEMEGASFAK